MPLETTNKIQTNINNLHKYITKLKNDSEQGRQNGFQSGGAMEHWKVLSATMVGRQEKVSNSRRSRMAKAIIFWPWWQPFDSFCFETLSFLPLSPFFLFATQKKWGGRHGPLGPSVYLAMKILANVKKSSNLQLDLKLMIFRLFLNFLSPVLVERI